MDGKLIEPWRFWTKVERDGECWEWKGSVSTTGYGYGRNWAGPVGSRTYAHRQSWELANGPIPEGLQIDHLCRNRLCVNPAHLEAVTQQENLLRGETVAARNIAKTHCSKGHEFTPENTYHRPGKAWRFCRTCNIESQKKFREEHGNNPYRKKRRPPRFGLG